MVNPKNNKNRKRVTMTRSEFDKMMLAATHCPDSGHAFAPGDDKDHRKSLDRIDNDRGYDLDNCRVVCAWVNRGRGASTLQQWWAIVAGMRGLERDECESVAALMSLHQNA
jgi:hypothetical protein